VRLYAEAVGGRANHRRAALGPVGRPAPLADHRGRQEWVQAKLGVTLAESQQAAVRMALASKVVVITGGPGVSKTTLVNAILKILAAKRVEVLLAAPTGRAAKRMTEATGLEAKTIHRLLEFDPAGGGFKRTGENPLDCNLLVLDETSMVDVPILASTLKAVRNGSAVILVGDVDQLPSVGPGQVLGSGHGSDQIVRFVRTQVERTFRPKGRRRSRPLRRALHTAPSCSP
jgi:exodeoxyribonuclease V alpha subunit